MRRRDRERLNDYQVNEDGEYEYAGVLWRLDFPQGRPAFLRATVAMMAGALACLLVAGCVPAPGATGAFYVLVPYAAAVVGYALSVVSLVRLVREGEVVRDFVYVRDIPALCARLVVAAACAGLAGGADVVHLVAVRPEGGAALCLAYAALCAAAAACLLMVRGKVMSLTPREDRA